MNPDITIVILSLFVAVTMLFRLAMHPVIRRGKVREAFCALWCMDTLFSLCGIVFCLSLCHFGPGELLTWYHISWLLVLLALTALFILLTPSGYRLFLKRSTPSKEELLLAEYRFDDTVSLLRNGLYTLLFAAPLVFAACPDTLRFRLPVFMKEASTCTGFCLTLFMLLLPISLRQSYFWCKNLTDTTEAFTSRALRVYCNHRHYRKRNFFIG